MAQPDAPERAAFAFLDAKEWGRARDAFLEILGPSGPALGQPAQVWFGLSRALAALGQSTESGSALARAYAFDPKNKDIALSAARHLIAARDFKQAIAVLRRALVTHQDDTDVLWLLADAYDLNGELQPALKVCNALAHFTPRDPRPFVKAATIHIRGGELAHAERDLRGAIAQDSHNIAALTMLPDVLHSQAKVEDERHFLLRRAASDPEPAARAVARFRAAAAQPVVLQSIEEAREARARFAAAVAAGPEMPLADPFRSGLTTTFSLNYQGENDRSLQEAYGRYCLAAAPSLGLVAPHVGRAVRDRRIKIGLVSAHLSNQTVGYLNYGLVRDLDRKRFDLVLFRPPHAKHDADSRRFEELARVVDLPGDLPAARTAIADEQLDILHFPEIGMDAFTYFIAFARLATVQTVAWGHPVTTGLPNIDYFLSVDDMEPPDGDQHYSERLIRLKGLSFAAQPPRDATVDRSELGLDEGPAYVCLQSLCKVHPLFDPVLAGILEKDPHGRLYFITNGTYADSVLLTRLTGHLGASAARIRFLPRLSNVGFLTLARFADAALDVPQWSGGKTSLDTLAMGTPIVHMPGEFMRGRHTLAFYRRMGVTTPIARSAEEYAEIAVRLAHDPTYRSDARRQIAETQSRLFEDWASIREIEDVWASLLAAHT